MVATLTQFQVNLANGQVGESRIAIYLKGQGFSVLPAYEKELQTGKGPRIFGPDGDLIVPDMLVFNGTNILWVEAKHKTGFTWFRKTERFQKGIDLRHYLNYLEVQDKYPFDVYLYFLHEGGQAKDSPPSPSGLFVRTLSYLREHEDHRWGTPPMVYWNIEDFYKVAELDELQ